jgi:large subunit ribosomal protein L21
MFAVVDIAGQQFNVEENKKYYVPRLVDSDVDSEVSFDSVLLYNDGKETKVGIPNIDGMKVTAKVLEHLKDEKVIVFKKKRRKSYKKKNGHRQHLTRIEVTKIA